MKQRIFKPFPCNLILFLFQHKMKINISLARFLFCTKVRYLIVNVISLSHSSSYPDDVFDQILFGTRIFFFNFTLILGIFVALFANLRIEPNNGK